MCATCLHKRPHTTSTTTHTMITGTTCSIACLVDMCDMTPWKTTYHQHNCKHNRHHYYVRHDCIKEKTLPALPHAQPPPLQNSHICAEWRIFMCDMTHYRILRRIVALTVQILFRKWVPCCWAHLRWLVELVIIEFVIIEFVTIELTEVEFRKWVPSLPSSFALTRWVRDRWVRGN